MPLLESKYFTGLNRCIKWQKKSRKRSVSNIADTFFIKENLPLTLDYPKEMPNFFNNENDEPSHYV